MEKNNPDVIIKIEYKGDMDIKFIAALTFIIGKWWMDTSFLSSLMQFNEISIEIKSWIHLISTVL